MSVDVAQLVVLVTALVTALLVYLRIRAQANNNPGHGRCEARYIEEAFVDEMRRIREEIFRVHVVLSELRNLLERR